MSSNWKFDTLAVQAGYEPKNGEARITPIVQATTYKYDDVQSVADLFDLKAAGFFYTRLANPTVDVFEKKMAALEGGVGAVAVSSGQTASAFSILNIARAGDHIVAASTLYGGTVSLFTNTLKKAGITFTFVTPDATDDEIRAAIKSNTKAIFIETLANPALHVADIELYAKIAHENGIPLIVDNTFPTPALCRPFEFGADIVVHSSSKYLDGHGTSVGGVIIEKGGFNWSNGKFPEFTEPDVSYHGLIYTRDFAAMPYTVKLRVQLVRDYGIPMMPFNAFLTNLGTETLPLRMRKHSENALIVAKYLQNHPKVAWIKYPGLEGDEDYERAKKYLPKGASGVIIFGAKGGFKGSEKLMNCLKLASIVVHVADARTGVLHPASMTHRQLSESELIAAGVKPDLIRLSVGLEDPEDIIADFEQAFEQI